MYITAIKGHNNRKSQKYIQIIYVHFAFLEIVNIITFYFPKMIILVKFFFINLSIIETISIR